MKAGISPYQIEKYLRELSRLSFTVWLILCLRRLLNYLFGGIVSDYPLRQMTTPVFIYIVEYMNTKKN